MSEQSETVSEMEASLTMRYATLADGTHVQIIDWMIPDLLKDSSTAVPMTGTADGNQSQDS